MARFRVPQMPIGVNIFTNATGDYPTDTGAPPRLANVPANLAYGLRVNVTTTGGTTLPGIPFQTMNLLLPKLTDIRGPQDSTSSQDTLTGVTGDYVEAPAGSGRLYVVGFVDDIGKGFPNEHRTATMYALPMAWTAPYP